MTIRKPLKINLESIMKSCLFFLILICITTLGCSRKSDSSCKMNPEIMKANDSIIKLHKEGNALFLNRLNEVELVQLKQSTIRLIVSESFSDTSILIYQITNSDKTINIKERIVFTDKCKRDQIKVFSGKIQDWDYLNQKFKESCFWSQLVWDNNRGLDGDTYSIEYYTPNNSEINEDYFRVFRWSPDENSMVKKMSQEIIQIIQKNEHNIN